MKKIAIFFIFFIAIDNGLLNAQEPDRKKTLSLITGWQHEEFQWSIAGNINGSSPNVYSELKWQQLKSYKVGASLYSYLFKQFFLTGNFYYAYTISGRVSDTDYQEDNRNSVTYQGIFNSNKGNSISGQVGIGYNLIKIRQFELAPILGYSSNIHTYFIQDDNNEAARLSSKYIFKQKGAFIRVTSATQLINQVKLALNITYYQLDYNAIADWNLIETFKHPLSFRQLAKGYELQTDTKFIINVLQKLSLELGAQYSISKTGKGIDELYLINNENIKTQFNGASLTGFNIFAGINLNF